MTTKFIGLKELRQNIFKISADIRSKNQRLIVLRKNVPFLEIKPITQKDVTLESLMLGLAEAEADIKAGRVYSQQEVEKMFGL